MYQWQCQVRADHSELIVRQLLTKQRLAGVTVDSQEPNDGGQILAQLPQQSGSPLLHHYEQSQNENHQSKESVVDGNSRDDHASPDNINNNGSGTGGSGGGGGIIISAAPAPENQIQANQETPRRRIPQKLALSLGLEVCPRCFVVYHPLSMPMSMPLPIPLP